MTPIEMLLTSRSSFELAALVVTWAAVLALVVIVGHLHARVQRLERAAAPARQSTPYSELVGRRLGDLLGESAAPPPRLVLLLSSTCRACAPLLAELNDPAWARLPSAIVWTDGDAPSSLLVPPAVRVVADGPRVAARLGVRITPFVVLAAADGLVMHAAPVNTLRSLDPLSGMKADAASGRAPTHVTREVARESGI